MKWIQATVTWQSGASFVHRHITAVLCLKRLVFFKDSVHCTVWKKQLTYLSVLGITLRFVQWRNSRHSRALLYSRVSSSFFAVGDPITGTRLVGYRRKFPYLYIQWKKILKVNKFASVTSCAAINTLLLTVIMGGMTIEKKMLTVKWWGGDQLYYQVI